MHTARESALAFVAGKKVEEIIALGEEIYDEEMADKIWSGTYALAMQHLDSGQRVWLVTVNPHRAGHDHRPPVEAYRRTRHGRRIAGRLIHRPAGR